MKDCFGSIHIPNNIGEILPLLEKAEQQIDDEVGVPRLAAGELGSPSPQTLGATSILANNASIVIRRAVKQWDDNITDPVVTGMYDHNMEHVDDDSIKGDMEIVTRGSATQLVMETQQQVIAYWMGLIDHPLWACYLDERKVARLAAHTQRFNLADIMRDEDEVKMRLTALRNNQGPEAMQAQLEMAKMELEQMKLQLQQAVEGAKIEGAEQERQLKLAVAQIERETAFIKMAADRQMASDKVMGELEKMREREAGETQRLILKEQAATERYVAEERLRRDTGAGI